MKHFRSTSTILNCTKVVDTYEFKGKVLEIRELINEARTDKLYIMCFREEINPTAARVRLVTEAIKFNTGCVLLHKIKTNYPSMSRVDRNILKHMIEITINEIL